MSKRATKPAEIQGVEPWPVSPVSLNPQRCELYANFHGLSIKSESNVGSSFFIAITSAVTGPPPKNIEFKIRVTGGFG